MKTNVNKGWTKSWSGRGTAILDKLENTNELKVKHSSTVLEKLEFLLKKYPQDNFYKSLKQQSTAKPLSEKQVQCVVRKYREVFSKKGRFA
jgi:hypothetical protein